MVTVLTTGKIGTVLRVLVPIEGALVPLALSGVTLAAGRGRLLAAAALAFTFAQTVALLVAPGRTVVPFIRPGSARGTWGYALSGAGVKAAAAAAPARRRP